MIRLLIPLLLLVLLVVMVRRYLAAGQTPEQQKSRKITLGLLLFAGLMILLTIAHRMHWIGSVLATLTLLGRLLINYWQGRGTTSHRETTSPPPYGGNKMTEEEALQILGLKMPCSREEVIDAHRKLIQKFHPDRGGNDYLASRINDAKEFLLQNFN